MPPFEPQQTSTARTRLRIGLHQVARSVAKEGRADSAEVGHDQFSLRSRLDRLVRNGVEDFGNAFALQDVDAAGSFPGTRPPAVPARSCPNDRRAALPTDARFGHGSSGRFRPVRRRRSATARCRVPNRSFPPWRAQPGAARTSACNRRPLPSCRASSAGGPGSSNRPPADTTRRAGTLRQRRPKSRETVRTRRERRPRRRPSRP